ncbi:40S ribosomal protein S2 [Hibiscus syriacus]|uniref:Small ribosomal subunit protein uS5 n=1 Tax=Hibiscus syriacus TaxID=106335 RepID=A0A6A2X403_HIBSY|nr:40S ribosomal protein S2 [Hibiscus syriacus]
MGSGDKTRPFSEDGKDHIPRTNLPPLSPDQRVPNHRSTRRPIAERRVMKITPVQKQTRTGQRTRFKAFVVVGDGNEHVGLGVKGSKEVATAIRGAIILAKLSVIPVRRGYWSNKIGKPHTVPCKVTGKDVAGSEGGSTKTLGNFVKATFECLMKTYGFLTPDFWKETRFTRLPFQEYSNLLGKPAKTLVLEDTAPVNV